MQRVAMVLISLEACLLMSGCDNPQNIGSSAPPQSQPTAVPLPPVAPGQPVPSGQPPAGAAQPVAPISPTTPTPPAATGDALVDRINTTHFEISPTAIATSTVLKQTIKQNATQAYQVVLPGPPYCHTMVAATADTLKNIDLTLEAPTGTVVAREGDAASVAVIPNFCPSVPGSYRLSVAIPNGQGEFAVQVFSR